jgi:hypothetical protein
MFHDNSPVFSIIVSADSFSSNENHHVQKRSPLHGSCGESLDELLVGEEIDDEHRKKG